MKKTILAIILFVGALLSAPAAQAQSPDPVVRVQVAPPAPQVEVVPVAPSPQHVWASGHWTWNGSRYVWLPGHWETLRDGYVWSPGHWSQDPSGAWVFRPGQWVVRGAGGGPAPTVVVAQAPPAVQAEVIPVAPSPGSSWIPGHWTWNGGRWVWAPGHWRATRHGYYWVQAHWQRTATGWAFIEGHYRPY